jgi:hypothetical protein
MSEGETLRRIRFKPELVEAIRSGRKMMTFRLTERPTGDYVRSLYGGKLPLRGWVHLFWAAKDENDFNAGRAIQPSEEIAQKVKEKFPDLFEDMKKAGELRFRRF